MSAAPNAPSLASPAQDWHGDAESPIDLEEPPIRLPKEPEEPPPAQFPLLMVIAPVFVSLILYAVIRSPYVFMFAIFGPILGIASVVDQRILRRRRRRREEARYAEELRESERAVEARLARIRRRLRKDRPFARDLVAGAPRIEPGAVVGSATVSSGIRFDGGGGRAETRALKERARQLSGAPVAVETTRIAVAGPRPVAVATVRALVVQLLAEDPSASLALAGERAAAVAEELRRAGVATEERSSAPLLVWAGGPEEPPPEAEGLTRLLLEEYGDAVLVEPSGRSTRIRADTLGAALLAEWLPRVRDAQAARAALRCALPDSVELEHLGSGGSGEDAARPGLGARFVLGTGGPLEIDLVADGPHAVIGGTTGSGKSELLIAWCAALARAHPSGDCTFLCIDFKGGATFDAVAGLPHCVGVVTDLDDDEALRVVASLRAEVRRRERLLRDRSVRDLADLEPGALARLVVLVDEYQALVETHPDLQEVFADLGARGRSLGVHLVLCTQRPTGTFREGLLANCAIRLCLRVEQASDSVTLLGSSEGADLPRARRGRALLRLGTDAVRAVQVARARPERIEEIALREHGRRREAGLGEVRRPWQRPLPRRLEPESLRTRVEAAGASPGGLPFALGDLPEEQAQRGILLDGAGDHCFVLGRRGSGKSGVLAAVAEGARHRGLPVVLVPDDAERAWDVLERLLHGPAGPWRIVLVDDADLLEQRFGEEHRVEWGERLQRLVRGGSQLGVSVVVTARRVSGALQRVRALCGGMLQLAAPSRQEWVLQGGESSHWTEDLPPGRGRYNGVLVQVAHTGMRLAPPPGPEDEPFAIPREGLAVVGRRLGPVRAFLERAGARIGPVPSAGAMRPGADIDFAGEAMVGDLEQWNAAYGVLPRLAERMPVLAAGLTAGEWRGLFRGDGIGPAVENPYATALLRLPTGAVRRVRLEAGAPSAVQRG
ncbi:FtsK/SpoIIIE domain-containing protein [Gulosibacter sp. 10]|uniref:FtsK/SpoIIIE domain-containing protein n=1 Tax=Gulosibacter sp. 10 TaxID=1255570 RepID=UPI00097EF2A7|nr:FtsK/SpoIIIE domain-containing protein [Gulosibacter sp. 10]SJM70882.1 Cell division protein FtsK [Gulosibacter sp. 10]